MNRNRTRTLRKLLRAEPFQAQTEEGGHLLPGWYLTLPSGVTYHGRTRNEVLAGAARLEASGGRR